jgi:hypothetical protein
MTWARWLGVAVVLRSTVRTVGCVKQFVDKSPHSRRTTVRCPWVDHSPPRAQNCAELRKVLRLRLLRTMFCISACRQQHGDSLGGRNDPVSC